MGPIIGNEEPVLGVRLLDFDHREMSDAFDDLKATVARGEGHGRAVARLRQLAHMTLSHFALEEGMMAATGFPGRVAHLDRHQRLMREIHLLQASLDRRGAEVRDNVIAQVAKWHHAHMHNDDLHYALWLNAVGKHV